MTQKAKAKRPARSKKLRVKPQPTTDWVEIFPYGISVGTGHGRPVLILKDAGQAEVLPVWLNPIDAGLALADLSSLPESSHGASRQILESLGVRVVRCLINEMIGHHQFVELVLEGHPRMKSIRVRADEAMSFCLAWKARFFSTREYMARCRQVDAELFEFEKGLLQRPEIGTKIHPYVM